MANGLTHTTCLTLTTGRLAFLQPQMPLSLSLSLSLTLSTHISNVSTCNQSTYMARKAQKAARSSIFQVCQPCVCVYVVQDLVHREIVQWKERARARERETNYSARLVGLPFARSSQRAREKNEPAICLPLDWQCRLVVRFAYVCFTLSVCLSLYTTRERMAELSLLLCLSQTKLDQTKADKTDRW